MQIVPVDKLTTTDLQVDAIYQGGRRGNAGDDPLPRLMRVDAQGGFRFRGEVKGRLDMLVLTTSMNDPDWPDDLDPETGVFTYYGDNKKPGNRIDQTGRDGNLILEKIFGNAQRGAEGRKDVPPIFLFRKAGVYRDVRFLGLAVPGVRDLNASEELVGIWRTSKGVRFPNYRARFTVLDAGLISRMWIDSIIGGKPDHTLAPDAWKTWRATGRHKALLAARTIEYRKPAEQLPDDSTGKAVIEVMRSHFEGRPHAFEYCAGALARMMVPGIAVLDVTRPSRDGGRDGIGQLSLGEGPSSILVDFALEAKCYGAKSAVGAKDMSRLISRLRHRQFGVLVTTSYVTEQIDKEIKEDRHPIVVIAARDIVELLRRNGLGSADAVGTWLSEEFPRDQA